MTATSNGAVPSSWGVPIAATVRLTPSTVIEPFSTT